MTDEKTIEIARYIFTTGKLIHDRILQVQAEYMASEGKQMISEMSVAQMHAIMKISDRGRVYMTELSGLLGVSPPSASAMVDRLVEKGVLVREHSTEDRRRVEVRISPESTKHIEKVKNLLLGTFVELVEKIGPETARKWCEVLEQVKSVIK